VDERAYTEMFELEGSHWWFRGRRAVIRALLGRAEFPDTPRLLDAGCGTGYNLTEFGSANAHGVDPSADAVAFCRQRGLGDVQQAGLEALPFAPDSFDLLMACDVVEHLEDDVAALVELRRVAAAGAVLLLTVPAYQWMWTEHDVQLHHVRRYTLSRLRDAVVRAGWDMVDATYFNSLMLPVVAALRLWPFGSRQGHTDLDRTPPGLNRVLELPMRAEAAAIARGVRLPAGVSLGMLCKNPG
jgi:SAM-dependent methyltransferase